VALDLMRRQESVPSGTMDFLIAHALLHFKEHGVAVASLGLAPLANTREGAHGWLERAMGTGMEWNFQHMNWVYHYKSLHAFKHKFNPRWEPRYLAYPSGAALPQVLYALVRVHLAAGRLGARGRHGFRGPR
jgi:phosphatidylglycerol lysyltransferase